MESVLQQASQADFQALIDQARESTVLRFSTAGSVDDGKSTLIGRLLFDSKNIYDDHLSAIEKATPASEGALSLALLTDGLRAEREQGITIDVAYRYFSTPKRRFILADTPGHEQYTRNMATGASTADVTIVLIDARKGVVAQTRRHSFIASLLGVPRLLVTVNKMDLVEYSKEVFEKIVADFSEFAVKLGIKDLRFIPVAALHGDNVVEPSKHMAWYHGETVMQYLENVYIGSDRNQVDFRFPVQYVIRPHQNYRGYAGQLQSGSIRVGEEVMVMPSQKRSRIRSIDCFEGGLGSGKLEVAWAPMSVAISLEDEIDISRGDMLVRPRNYPKARTDVDALVVWMSETPMDRRKEYLILHTSRESRAAISQIDYRVDVNTLSRMPAAELALNEIGRVSFKMRAPIFVDSYSRNRNTGSFVIVDSEDFRTVGVGMALDRIGQSGKDEFELSRRELHREEGAISRKDREQLFDAKAQTFWMTGLSGSGKSTVAKLLEERLFRDKRPVYRLDGDNLRFGLNRDLGFSKDDRTENIRRVAEVAKLLNDAGISVICSFISPYRADRENARQIIGDESFLEIYLATPLEVCEKRDPHGLYKKARVGELKEFTGVSAPYEEPLSPEITIDSSKLSPAECVDLIVTHL